MGKPRAVTCQLAGHPSEIGLNARCHAVALEPRQDLGLALNPKMAESRVLNRTQRRKAKIVTHPLAGHPSEIGLNVHCLAEALEPRQDPSPVLNLNMVESHARHRTQKRNLNRAMPQPVGPIIPSGPHARDSADKLENRPGQGTASNLRAEDCPAPMRPLRHKNRIVIPMDYGYSESKLLTAKTLLKI